MTRDAAYERTFLAEAARACERRHGLPAGGFVRAVQARLAEGQALYGDRFVGLPRVEQAREIAEEGLDAAAYGVLVAQGIAVVDSPAMWTAFEAAVHGAAIHTLAGRLAGD